MSAAWSQAQPLLNALSDLVDQALQSAQDSVATGNADGFAATCNQLSQGLTQVQTVLKPLLAQGQPPADILLKLQQIQANLSTLQETTTRQEASVRQSLAVLFPADQVQAYSRLGSRFGGYGAQGRPSQGYVKA